MENQCTFGNTFKYELSKSRPYLILGTVMYLITISVAYGVMSTFDGATFSLSEEILLTTLRDYLVIPGLFVFVALFKTVFQTLRKPKK